MLSLCVLASLCGIPMNIREEKEVGSEVSIAGGGGEAGEGAGVGFASGNEICTYYYAM